MKFMVSVEGSLEKIAKEVSEKSLLFTGKSLSTFVAIDGQNEDCIRKAIRDSIGGSILNSLCFFNVNLYFTDYDYPNDVCSFAKLLNGPDIVNWIMDKFTGYYATFAIIINNQKKGNSKVWIFTRF